MLEYCASFGYYLSIHQNLSSDSRQTNGTVSY